MATVKDDVNQERQHLQPTKKPSPTHTTKKTQENKYFNDITLYYFPPSYVPNIKTNGVIYSMIKIDEKPRNIWI